ncbi:MAG: hypothetical protein HRU19_16605 [Pseudobacteriovorax sp.]|nr:hypothetical protein [Pseudobacteriovorax sp.]
MKSLLVLIATFAGTVGFSRDPLPRITASSVCDLNGRGSLEFYWLSSNQIPDEGVVVAKRRGKTKAFIERFLEPTKQLLSDLTAFKTGSQSLSLGSVMMYL